MDAGGKPLVKRLASCAKLKGSDAETCRGIFVGASNCSILPPDYRGENDDAPLPPIPATGPDPVKLKQCVADAVLRWLGENPELATAP